MRFGAQILKSYCNINDFSYSSTFNINEGENSRLYLQLADLDQKLASDINSTVYQRYLPPSGSALTVNVSGANSANNISKIANQVAGDNSLWYIDLLPTDIIQSGNIHLTLNEPGGIVRKGLIIEGLKVYPTDPSSTSFC